MPVSHWLSAESLSTLNLLPLLAAALLHFLWQGAVIALGLRLALACCNERRVNVRYALTLVALALVIVAVPMTMMSLAGSGVRSPIEPLAAVHFESTQVEGAWVPSAPMEIGSDNQVSALVSQGATISWQPWLVGAWLIGVVCFSLRMGLGWIGTLELRRSGEVTQWHLQSQVMQLASKLGIRQRVLVRASQRVTGAVVVGLLRPMILAPACWLSETSPEVLEAVLAHELAHIRRGDLWVNLIQRIVETLLFYHPAVWWISGRIRHERELCCDQLAIGATQRPVAYAKALEWAARQNLDQGQLGWAAAFTGDRNMTLKQRVQMVLGISTNQRGRSWPVAVAGLGLATVMGLALFGGTAFNTAVADEGDRPREGEREVRREGDRPVEARREGERREGDRAPEARREGERREGDRPAEARREGEFRDGDRRPEERREGLGSGDAERLERARAEAERREREEIARRLSGARNEDLVRMILELREQVRHLSNQVNAMQRERAESRERIFNFRDGERREGDRPLLRDGDRPILRDGDRPILRDGERREGDRPILRDGERREGDRPVIRDGDRPREEVRREGDRPREEPRREGEREGDRD